MTQLIFARPNPRSHNTAESASQRGRSGVRRTIASARVCAGRQAFRTRAFHLERVGRRAGEASDFGGATAVLRDPRQWQIFVEALFVIDWIVYAKPAFGGASAVLRFLGR